MNLIQNDSHADDEIAPGISPVPYSELAKLDIPLPSWIVDRLIPDSSITILSAAPSQFKTWLAFDVAIHVAHGNPLFDQFETKQRNVLIIDEESNVGLLRERLKLLGITDDSPIAIASKGGFKLTKKNANSLVAYCKQHNIGLVIFDSLTRFHNGNENDAKDMSVVMGNFMELTKADLAVVLIHHNRKPAFGSSGGANEMRGSGDIYAASDVQISMKRDSASRVVEIKQNKNRYTEELPPFNVELMTDDGGLYFEYRGNAPKRAAKLNKRDNTDNAIRELLSDGKPQYRGQIIEAIKGPKNVGGDSMITDRLKVLAEAGELIHTAGASNNKQIYALKAEQTDE